MSPAPQPRAEELRRFADGLRAMAAELASAQERERTLERRLGQEQRLYARMKALGHESEE